jgi:hypothetical protein
MRRINKFSRPTAFGFGSLIPRSLALAFCAVVSLVGMRSAFGQMTTGTIMGSVTDPSGASIPEARVTVTNTGTGVSRSFVTGPDGRYVVPSLIPGAYSVSAEKQGFNAITKTGIALQVDQTARIDLTLQVGTVTQRVNVKTQTPLLQTQSSGEGTTITASKMVSMPLNLRQFANLVNLTPGATAQGMGNNLGDSFSGDNPQAIDASSVNGIESDGNNWTIGGISDNEAFFSILTVSPSLDAIQEFKVNDNNYSAEFGRAGGAQVDIVIKSGTNQFHGDAFEFFRSSGLEANDFFSNASGLPIAPYHQNQFGANIGGPIVKNNTFFFVDYEGLRTVQGQTGLSTIPTVSQRTGDFSAPGNPVIYDPFSLNGAGQPQPFAGNIIPSSQINPATAKIMALFPAPNVIAPVGEANYIGRADLTHQIDEGDVTIDHMLTSKDHLTGRLSLLRTTLSNPSYLGPVLLGSPAGIFAYTLNQNDEISETHIFSPTTLNEFRVGFNRVNTNWYSLAEGLDTSNQVGIPGINNFCSTCGGLPTIDVSNISSFGDYPYAPTIRHDNTFEWVDNVTFVRGKHTFKVGADIQRLQADLYQTDNSMGSFDFNTDNTSLDGAPGTGDGIAGFLLGYPDSEGRAALTDSPSQRVTQSFFFGQDDFQVKKNLTLNLGLRWEIYGAPTDAWGNQANFNISTGNIQLACIAISCSAGIPTYYGDFAPRFGFAYSVGRSRKTVLRAGFGVAYFYPGYGESNIGTLNVNYPFVIGQAYSPANLFAVTPGDPVLTEGMPVPPKPQVRPAAPPGNLIPNGGGLTGEVGSIFYMPSDLHEPNILQWSLDLQRELTPNLMLSVEYSANKAGNLSVEPPLNYPAPGVVTATGETLQEARPYYDVDPFMAEVTEAELTGWSYYNSLQVELQKRTSFGLSFLASYTWDHDLGRGEYYTNPQCFMCQEATLNQPAQIFSLSYTYQIPFGHGEHFGSSWNKWTNAFLGGWEWSGITSYNAGLPYSVGEPSSLDNGNGDMPNRICNGTVPNPNIEEWFNPGCFQDTALNVFGNAGYNFLYGPRFEDWDMALMKNVHLTESKSFQFRAEFYNTFNEVNFGTPNSYICVGCGAGTITGYAYNYNPRLVQIALKFFY